MQYTNQSLYSQKTPSRASYGVYIVRILEKFDRCTALYIEIVKLVVLLVTGVGVTKTILAALLFAQFFFSKLARY